MIYHWAFLCPHIYLIKIIFLRKKILFTGLKTTFYPTSKVL